ncbi:transglutaminase family protein [Rhodoplanes sp. TEM]|uniref:Transglutaminase family protein n=1 Tax=Rhodoplanes tepidamans TaxID=200616 RepID=A0ABT5J7V3_RHOTP|nr:MULTISPECIES: transglutaminase family protein [Rhodoplanes]MDC7785374.1 transglutaminase family protein [Rhodoplanes tepidamans]MDC7984332.1 transglutaminase family protein [Rhodoplanes sp. TEM]MDQ0353174.1 transglutaminase-like putative cysteine protease [Rhodoplanes tepidamans]
MARLEVVHTTEYAYRTPVGLGRHRLMVRPDESHDLRLHRADLVVAPAPARTTWKHDIFGNSICFLDWSDATRTDRLTIVSTLDLTHHPDGPPLPRYILEPQAEAFPFAYAAGERADLGQLAVPQEPDPDGTVAAWARRMLGEAGSSDTLDVLAAMTRAIKAQFGYRARYEEGTQTAADTIRGGSGTCRDFAVLMMEALRSFGVATRFVTGYLYDDTSGGTVGGGSTHAWCSVYLPGAGWVEYDPTNGLLAGANLIRVGTTRDAAQASPISGSFAGRPDDPIGLHVDVSVTYAPIHGA